MKHTPTPWTIQKDGTGSIYIAGNVSPDPVTEARYLFVAHALATQSPNPLWRQTEEREANAAFMRRACNNFEALLEAARQVRESYSFDSLGPGTKLLLEKAIADAERSE